MRNINAEIPWLLQKMNQEPTVSNNESAVKIKLSQLISRLSFFYEKFRNAIDYNEEHLIRRRSLTRFLRRQMLFLQERDANKLSKALIYEFIRIKYLPNDTLPETIIDDLAKIIVKYCTILNYFQTKYFPKKQKIIDWTIELASCEIDEFFFSPEKDLAMVNFMYSQMVSSISFTDPIDEKEKNLQIYIAVLKTIGKADINTIYYRLIQLHIQQWGSLSDEKVLDFCRDLRNIKEKIDSHLNNSISFQLQRIIKRQSVFFTIIKDIISRNHSTVESLEDETKITNTIKETCEDNYHHLKSKLVGSIIRVIIYLFFTKTILAFIIEIPYDLFFLGKIHYTSLLINICFHPLLMFFVAMTIKVPGNNNTQTIINEVKKIIYGEERKIAFKEKKLLKKGSSAFMAMNIIYGIMFLVTFGILVYLLYLLDFTLMSGLLFLFFLTLVSFFGFRLRNIANQFLVLQRKENLRNFIIDFFSLPIVRVGRALSTNFSKVNIFLYFFDFIIETPFKMLVEFLEQAMSFIKEKRDEITE